MRLAFIAHLLGDKPPSTFSISSPEEQCPSQKGHTQLLAGQKAFSFLGSLTLIYSSKIYTYRFPQMD